MKSVLDDYVEFGDLVALENFIYRNRLAIKLSDGSAVDMSGEPIFVTSTDLVEPVEFV